MAEALAARLVPDDLWSVVAPLLPSRQARPQGGGMSRVDDRAVFTAVVYVLTSGCAWRALPSAFPVKVPTVHRRFAEWTRDGLWSRLRAELTGRPDFLSDETACWLAAVLDGVEDRLDQGQGKPNETTPTIVGPT